MTDLTSILTDGLASRIRERRVAQGLSQVAAARRLKVSLRTLQAWEAGSAFPQMQHRRRLARFLETEQREP